MQIELATGDFNFGYIKSDKEYYMCPTWRNTVRTVEYNKAGRNGRHAPLGAYWLGSICAESSSLAFHFTFLVRSVSVPCPSQFTFNSQFMLWDELSKQTNMPHNDQNPTIRTKWLASTMHVTLNGRVFRCYTGNGFDVSRPSECSCQSLEIVGGLKSRTCRWVGGASVPGHSRSMKREWLIATRPTGAETRRDDIVRFSPPSMSAVNEAKTRIGNRRRGGCNATLSITTTLFFLKSGHLAERLARHGWLPLNVHALNILHHKVPRRLPARI